MLGSEYKALFLLPALYFIGWAVFTLYRALSGKYQKDSLQNAYYVVFEFSDGSHYKHNVETKEHADEVISMLSEKMKKALKNECFFLYLS